MTFLVDRPKGPVFLKDYLRSTPAEGYVLGISGGQDSALAGRLCQLAGEELRAEGHAATFVAVRLPYGVQADEDDAQLALEFGRPDRSMSVNVKPSADAAEAALGVRELPRCLRSWEHHRASGRRCRPPTWRTTGPRSPDEEALGLKYAQIDDYLEGADVTPDVTAKVESLYMATRHKRAVPVTPLDDWWRTPGRFRAWQ